MKKALIFLLLIAGLAWAERVQITAKIDRKVYKNTRQIVDLIRDDSPKMGEVIFVNDKFMAIGYVTEADSVPKDTLALVNWKRITGISIRIDTLKAKAIQAEP